MKKFQLFLITLLLLMGVSAVRAADAMYAVLDNGKLTFYPPYVLAKMASV